MRNAIEKRFSSHFDNKDYILAAISSPKFKVKWCVAEEKKKKAIELLRTEILSMSKSTNDQSKSIKDNSSFDFDFENSSAESTEVDDFLLSKSKELSVLDSFPTIKKVFMKYNVVQPSSATSERLFSKGKLIITTKRNKLSDSNFSKLLFLHIKKSSELTKPKEKDCGCIIKYKI